MATAPKRCKRSKCRKCAIQVSSYTGPPAHAGPRHPPPVRPCRPGAGAGRGGPRRRGARSGTARRPATATSSVGRAAGRRGGGGGDRDRRRAGPAAAGTVAAKARGPRTGAVRCCRGGRRRLRTGCASGSTAPPARAGWSPSPSPGAWRVGAAVSARRGMSGACPGAPVKRLCRRAPRPGATAPAGASACRSDRRARRGRATGRWRRAPAAASLPVRARAATRPRPATGRSAAAPTAAPSAGCCIRRGGGFVARAACPRRRAPAPPPRIATMPVERPACRQTLPSAADARQPR